MCTMHINIAGFILCPRIKAFYTEKLFSWQSLYICSFNVAKIYDHKLSCLIPGPWFSGAELILWRLLLTADACSAGERGFQEPAVGTPRDPTRKQLHLYAGPQPGRLTSGGARGHPGSATTLSLRLLPSLRTTGQMLRREDRNKWKNVAVWAEVSCYHWYRIRYLEAV